jgi:hypothetical protein
MAAKGNKCCCCGECNGPAGCCTCVCKTLCFTLPDGYTTQNDEGDSVGGVYSGFIRYSGGAVSVSVALETDEYGQCYRVTREGTTEKSRDRIPEDVSCSGAMSGSIATSAGTVSFQCATKVRTDCVNCDCLCECLCVTVYENDSSGASGSTSANIWFGKACFAGGQFSGSLPNIDLVSPDGSVVISFPKTQDPYDNEKSCEMKVTFNGDDSELIALNATFCERENFQMTVPIYDQYGVEKYTVLFQCASCEEECKIIPNCYCYDDATNEYIFIPNTLTVSIRKTVEVSGSPPTVCTNEFSFPIFWRGKNRTQQSNAWYSEGFDLLDPSTDPVTIGKYDYDSLASNPDCPMRLILQPVLCSFTSFTFNDAASQGDPTLGSLGLVPPISCRPFEANYHILSDDPGDYITITA